MNIEELSERQIAPAIALIYEVFHEFVAPDHQGAGIQTFNSFLQDPQALGQLAFFGAFIDGKLVGCLAVRNQRQHIALFFVAKEYQHQGIGKSLWQYLKNSSDQPVITVHSTPYAVPIYQRLGFEPIGPEQTADGIRYTPMHYLK